MSKRLQSFISLKENAYQLAMEREFIKKEIVTYKICLHLKDILQKKSFGKLGIITKTIKLILVMAKKQG